MADNPGFEDKIAKDLDKIEEDLDQEVAIEKAQLQRVGGTLTRRQAESLHDVDRLIKSLGPTYLEDELLGSNYNRPIPRIATHGVQPLQKGKSRAATSNESD